MKASITANKPMLVLSILSAVIFILLPFHAFLTVWLASALDHYTLLRLWKEFILVAIAGGVLYVLAKDKDLRRQFISTRLAQLVLAYFLVSLAWGFSAYVLEKTTIKALGFGIIVNLRFLVFFLAVWIIATKSQWLKKAWPKLLLIPAALVVVIGILQRLALPYDVLKHFGYSSQTIFPYQTINYDINYPRVMSTLRGANPLGAYLILILSTLAVFSLKFKSRRWLFRLFGLAALLALFFSYSRGAWLGLGLSGLLLTWLSLRGKKSKQLFLSLLGLAVIIASVFGFALRNNSTFENYFFHTSDSSTIKESSNEAHVSAFKKGLDDLTTEPLGRGVGTAGPASVYNDNQTRIAENYFIQIAQEIGWLGLVLFLFINFLVARELWFRRNDTLARILLVSFAGLTALNFVSHAWTDDTLSYIWWGLAGIALAPAILTDRKHKQHEKAKQATT